MRRTSFDIRYFLPDSNYGGCVRETLGSAGIRLAGSPTRTNAHPGQHRKPLLISESGVYALLILVDHEPSQRAVNTPWWKRASQMLQSF